MLPLDHPQVPPRQDDLFPGRDAEMKPRQGSESNLDDNVAPLDGGRNGVEVPSLFASSPQSARLFLTATPHNGHPNSFSALMEILDPQRFIRGQEIEPAQLEPVIVRRLKEDLRRLGQTFPERRIEPIVIDGLPETAPELVLAAKLAEYRDLRRTRLESETVSRRAQAELVWSGLQQRLLSSIEAFARTLAVHEATLQRVLERGPPPRQRINKRTMTLLSGVGADECRRSRRGGIAGGRR